MKKGAWFWKPIEFELLQVKQGVYLKETSRSWINSSWFTAVKIVSLVVDEKTKETILLLKFDR